MGGGDNIYFCACARGRGIRQAAGLHYLWIRQRHLNTEMEKQFFFRFSFAVYSVCTTFAVEKRYRTATIRSGYSSIKIRKPGRTLLPMAGHSPILFPFSMVKTQKEGSREVEGTAEEAGGLQRRRNPKSFKLGVSSHHRCGLSFLSSSPHKITTFTLTQAISSGRG